MQQSSQGGPYMQHTSQGGLCMQHTGQGGPYMQHTSQGGLCMQHTGQHRAQNQRAVECAKRSQVSDAVNALSGPHSSTPAQPP